MAEEPSRPVIFTVGTGHRSLEELVALLRAAGVTRVADVRSYPKSHLPHFDRGELEGLLPVFGIDYAWLGADLGGLRREGYETYMGSERFRRGLALLEGLAREQPTALLCAELDPTRCHRRWIAAALADTGWRVVNLGAPDAYPEQEPVQPGLPFGEEESTR